MQMIRLKIFTESGIKYYNTFLFQTQPINLTVPVETIMYLYLLYIYLLKFSKKCMYQNISNRFENYSLEN